MYEDDEKIIMDFYCHRKTMTREHICCVHGTYTKIAELEMKCLSSSLSSGNRFMSIKVVWYGKVTRHGLSSKNTYTTLCRFFVGTKCMNCLHRMIDCCCLDILLRIDIRLLHCALCTCLLQPLIGFLFLYLVSVHEIHAKKK